MNLFKSNKQHISKTEMENYLNNSLSDKEKNSLETAMQNEPFLADAMDGYTLFPNEINKVPTYKKNNKKGYLFGGLAILIIGVVLFLIIDNQNSESKFTPNKANLVALKEANNAKLPTNEVIEKNATKNEQKTSTVITKQSIEQNEETVTLVRESISLEKYKATPEIYSQEQNYDIKKLKIKTIAYYNFLAVDYSVIYLNEATFEEVEIGTPASQPNNENQNLTENNKISKTLKFTYKEYLKKSLKLLSEKQYNNAINNFTVILKHYPNDVNAQFYAGFANYNLKNYPKAIAYFDKVAENSFDFFYEDAYWYKALALEQNGRFKEANKLFVLIATQKGYYATQAAKK